jgi:peptidoglycan/LPS O-acetylase OafA/YrhL
MSRKLLGTFSIGIICVSAAWLFFLGMTNATEPRVWYDSVVQFGCFGTGILLCLALHGKCPRFGLVLRVLLFLGSLLCWFFAVYSFHARFEDWPDPGGASLVAGYTLANLGSVGMLLSFLGVDPEVLPKQAIYLGRISFGLYVFHAFALWTMGAALFGPHGLARRISHFPQSPALRDVAAFALTVLVAAISYRYLETPFLRMKARHALIRSQPIAGVE